MPMELEKKEGNEVSVGKRVWGGGRRQLLVRWAKDLVSERPWMSL